MRRGGHVWRFASELEQRKRIATRRVQHPVGPLRRDLAGRGLLEQRGRGRMIEAAQPQLGKAGGEQRRLLFVANRDEDRDRIGEQPASGESDGLRGRPIQPLRIVNGDQEWPFLRVGGNQAKRRGTDDEPVGLDPGAEPE